MTKVGQVSQPYERRMFDYFKRRKWCQRQGKTTEGRMPLSKKSFDNTKQIQVCINVEMKLTPSQVVYVPMTVDNESEKKDDFGSLLPTFLPLIRMQEELLGCKEGRSLKDKCSSNKA